MELNIVLEEQQPLNEDNEQVIEQKTTQATQTMADLMNSQLILHDEQAHEVEEPIITTNLLEQGNENESTIEEITDVLEAENKQDDVELDEENPTFLDAIEILQNLYGDLNNQINNDNKMFDQINSINEILIKSIHLDVPEVEKIESQENCIKIIGALVVDLTQANKSYICGISIGSKYSSGLKTHHLQLELIDKIINNKVNSMCSIDLAVNEITNSIQKMKKLPQKLKIFQNMNTKSQVQLVGLQNLTTPFINDDCVQAKINLASLKQNQTDLKKEIHNFYSQFRDVKEKYSSILKAYSDQLEKINAELTKTRKNLEQVKQDYHIQEDSSMNFSTYIEKILNEIQQKTTETLHELQEQLTIVENQFKFRLVAQTRCEIVLTEFTLIRIELKLANAISSYNQYSERRLLLDSIHTWDMLAGPTNRHQQF